DRSRRTSHGGAAQDVDHARLLAPGEAARAREADAAREEIFRDLAAYALDAPEEGLQVHRLPDRPRLDVLARERRDEIVAGRAEALLVDQEAAQPARVPAPRRLFLRLEPRQIGQRLPIALEHGASLRDALVEHGELPATDAGEHV